MFCRSWPEADIFSIRQQLSIDKLNPNITLYFSLLYLYIISIFKIKLEKKNIFLKKRSDFQTKNRWLAGWLVVGVSSSVLLFARHDRRKITCAVNEIWTHNPHFLDDLLNHLYKKIMLKVNTVYETIISDTYLGEWQKFQLCEYCPFPTPLTHTPGRYLRKFCSNFFCVSVYLCSTHSISPICRKGKIPSREDLFDLCPLKIVFDTRHLSSRCLYWRWRH